jgi:hypothetical protein
VLVRLDIILSGVRALVRSGKKTIWMDKKEFAKIKK